MRGSRKRVQITPEGKVGCLSPPLAEKIGMALLGPLKSILQWQVWKGGIVSVGWGRMKNLGTLSRKQMTRKGNSRLEDLNSSAYTTLGNYISKTTENLYII